MTLALRPQCFVALSLVVGACTTAPTPPASPNQGVAPATTTATLGPRVQQIAREELEHAVAEWHAVTGAVVVLDLRTGAILAMEGSEHGRDDAMLPSRRTYVTGSTLKTFTIVAPLRCPRRTRSAGRRGRRSGAAAPAFARIARRILGR